MLRHVALAFTLSLALAPVANAVDLPRTAAPAKARVYFISPSNGQVLKGPVTVRFGLAEMGVAPAGTVAEGTGHHHLVIDSPLPALDQPLPKDDKHLHFGKGQTETTLTLAPGKHTLQLILADSNHIPHQPPVYSAPITITVK
ncbi:MAG: DUF4399 domain-containing protein [Frankiaceae bacterium]|nr:DUF4399 domain-containing protein [Arenimonas sp.]